MAAIIAIYDERITGNSLLPVYLVSFDHEAHNGQGSLVYSDRIDRAMQFTDHGAAFEFWRKQSVTRPLRDDGKPNRPLTASTVQIIEC